MTLIVSEHRKFTEVANVRAQKKRALERIEEITALKLAIEQPKVQKIDSKESFSSEDGNDPNTLNAKKRGKKQKARKK